MKAAVWLNSTGVDWNVHDGDGLTPLIHSAVNVQLAQTLLAGGADPHLPSLDSGSQPLYYAVQAKNL
jgi:hypothetical protein